VTLGYLFHESNLWGIVVASFTGWTRFP